MQRLRARYARSPVPAFLSWWGRELVGCLPQSWRGLFEDGRRALVLRLLPDRLVIERERAGRFEPLREIELAAEDAELERQWNALWTAEQEEGLRCYLLLDEQSVLRRELRLPAAAEDGLSRVVSFEIDRQTPFRPDQVYFDSQVIARDTVARQVQVEMVVVPKPLLDAQVNRVVRLGVALDGIDVDSDGRRIGVNLLPEARRAHHSSTRLRWNFILAGFAVVLLGLVMWQSLLQREQALQQMQEAVNAVRAEAHEVAELKKSLTEAVAAANFLAERKSKAPVIIDVLNELTVLLPDDTWLERVNLQERELQLQGQAPEAAKLIGLLQSAKTFSSPTFTGVIQPDPQTRKERFTLSVTLIEKEASADATAPGSR